MHAEHIEVIRCDPAAEDLHRIAQSGQSEGELVFRGKSIKDGLALPEMLETRCGNRELEKISLSGVGVHANDTCRFLEWQSAQKKIVD